MLTYLPATEPLLPALKALNSDIFPIQYNDSFYASVLVNASFSVLDDHKTAIDSESDTETESEKESEQRLVGAICCRREPPPPPPPSIPSIPSSTTFPHSQNTQNPQPTQPTPNDSLYIMTIGVLDTFRGKGIGSSLLTSLLEQARTALPPLDSVRLHVHVANTSALRFYRKHGFELVQTVYGYYRLNKGVEPPDAYYLMFDLRGRRDCDVVCIVCEGRCGCSLRRRVGGGGGGGGGALSNVKVRYETLLEVGGGNQSVSSVGVAAAATEYRNLDPFKQRLSRLPPRSSSATNSHSSKPWNPREECVKNENGTDQMEESDSARVRSWDYQQKASIASRLQEHLPQQKPTIASRLQEYAPQQYYQHQQPYQQTYQQQYQQHYQQQLYNQQQRLYQQQSSHNRPPPPSPPTYAPPSTSSYQMFREYVPPSEYNE
ncbi:N-alpha-acetyltransferase 50 [Rhizoclosmatium sp. JEL0117]|nr:N-alpha-acetyltransferase 50 [Rhizoclosmatium sp. JEL0117]